MSEAFPAGRYTLQPGQIRLRHIRMGTSTDAGAMQVLGKYFVPQDQTGINGPLGFIKGSYERRLNDEGRFSITFPNSAGSDGKLHRDRFDVLTRGTRIPSSTEGVYGYTGGDYRPGDEWIEIYWGDVGGTLLFVGTPTSATVSRAGEVTLNGFDALWLLKKVRGVSTDFWANAPRDVFEYYTRVWQFVNLEEFNTAVTYSTSPATVGSWTYVRAATSGGTNPPLHNGAVRLTGASGQTASIVPSFTDWGANLDDQNGGWRLEVDIAAVYHNPVFTGGNEPHIDIQMLNNTDPADVNISIYANRMLLTVDDGTGNKLSGNISVGLNRPLPTTPFTISIEQQGRFTYFYVNGSIYSYSVRPRFTSGLSVRPQVLAVNDCAVEIDRVSYRKMSRFGMGNTQNADPPTLGLANTGDYRLPGVPPGGGLLGQYYADEGEFGTVSGDLQSPMLVMAPSREPYQERLDAQININNAGTPNAWNGGGNTFFSVRWSGSIFLDLATSDKFLNLSSTGTVGGRARMFVGPTREGEPYLDYYTITGSAIASPAPSVVNSPSLRTWLGTSVSGWYPIVIEYQFNGLTPYTQVIQLVIATATSGPWSNLVASSQLSPYGIYNNPTRSDSHFAQLQTIAETYALQYVCTPQQLESGTFPGRIIPFTRVGRDTNKVVDTLDTTEVQVDVNAEEVADLLIADASGLADDRQSGQLTGEITNTTSAPSHPFLATEYESLSEISNEILLSQRLNSLISLRGSAWEQTSARPYGFRQLVDSFPLTGSLAEFAWEPGDGVRLVLPEIGVEDLTPRQILGIQRDFVPNGLQQPTASFRQRPRSLRETIRSMQRVMLQQIRNYQGQFVTWSGNVAGYNTNSVYSRVTLPDDLSRIVEARVVVTYKENSTSWTLEVNDKDISGLAVTGTGPFIVTPFVAKINNEPRMYCRLWPGTGGSGTGAVVYQLLVTVLI